ncbi:iron export ABC transporter permease subunit FetB [Ectothiorhodospiraceae bacterium BW-2]|nr:iron export ABC transporter permease subunit FetB [Ectothiorhodospiraceae bacterium BW-2]
MSPVVLSYFDLLLASLLVLGLGISSWLMQLSLERQLFWAALRTTVQLILIGYLLKLLFAQQSLLWVGLMALVMLLVAGREVWRRQSYPFRGWYGYALGTVAMFLSSFCIALLALQWIIQPEPWYLPHYAIPLLGMLLGNTMNGISLALDRLTSRVREQRRVVEARLMLGQSGIEAIGDIRLEATRVGMIPMINAMAAAGIVSLPGMMTGQILAGVAPMEAVNYQILMMFLITAGSGFGTLLVVRLASRRLFDSRQRLRLDRLRQQR